MIPARRNMRRDPKVGDRVYWLGDNANAAHDGTIITPRDASLLDGGRYIAIRWDDAAAGERGSEEKPCFIPAGLLDGKRWGFIDDRDRARREAEAERQALEFAEHAPAVEAIAREVLQVETLETRNSDRLDFHDLAVWRIREALAKAYLRGIEAGKVHAAEAGKGGVE